MDGYYRCVKYDGTLWSGIQNDYYLDIEIATTETTEGYIIEAYFPFSSLGMEDGTKDIYVFLGAFVNKVDNTFAERYGLVNKYNVRKDSFEAYFRFDENSYLVERLFADDIVLTAADIDGENYIKNFSVYADLDEMV
ncbi:MAG: hypothetical protein PHS54_05950 [Clostridia bacterium]|nr:hypothetical protein [Clostridia bacterium]